MNINKERASKFPNFEITGEYRYPRKGEWYWLNTKPEQANMNYSSCKYLIMKKKEQETLGATPFDGLTKECLGELIEAYDRRVRDILMDKNHLKGKLVHEIMNEMQAALKRKEPPVMIEPRVFEKE
jgi:hypothetical protein